MPRPLDYGLKIGVSFTDMSVSLTLYLRTQRGQIKEIKKLHKKEV